MITFLASSDCKFCFLVPGITHSQETQNHDKKQAVHLSLFFDNRLISIETENQNNETSLKSAKLVALCENYNLQDINKPFQSFNAAVPSDFTKKDYYD